MSQGIIHPAHSMDHSSQSTRKISKFAYAAIINNCEYCLTEVTFNNVQCMTDPYHHI